LQLVEGNRLTKPCIESAGAAPGRYPVYFPNF
jgi:hypothetical protein